MTEPCPTCGAPLPQDGRVRVDLGRNVVVIGSTAVQLLPRQAEVLSVLVEAMPRTLTRGYMIERIYGFSDPPSEKCVEVYVYQIRKKLRGKRLQIKTVWGRGYRAEAA